MIIEYIYAYFPIILDVSINRENLIKQLSESGIASEIHYYPNHCLVFTVCAFKNTVLYPNFLLCQCIMISNYLRITL